jgi:hypothetical protein
MVLSFSLLTKTSPVAFAPASVAGTAKASAAAKKAPTLPPQAIP